MKKWTILTLCMLLTLACTGAFADVALNETHFPDTNFRMYVSTEFDEDGNGILSDTEVASVFEIDCSCMDIRDLTGLEYFAALRRLDCYDNRLTQLDVSGNPFLTVLDCSMNQLMSLNVCENAALVLLECSSNDLTHLDVSRNLALESLWCEENRLTSLDVSQNTALQMMNCSSNRIEKLDLSANIALGEIWCDGDRLISLNLGRDAALQITASISR